MVISRLWKWLRDQRGEVVPGTATTPDPSTNGAASPWYSSLPPDLQNDPTIKATPDVATLAKRFVDTNKEFGQRLKVPGKDANPAERDQFGAKLKEAGYNLAKFTPPESPDKYTINRDKIPEKAWSTDIEKEYRQLAHEYGVPDEFMQKAMGVMEKQFGQATQAYEVDHAKATEFLTKQAEELHVAPNVLVAAGDEALTQIFKSNPEGLKYFKNFAVPEVMAAFGRLGLMMAEDNGITGDFTDPAAVDAQKEIHDIQYNKDHPKHDRWLNMHSKNDKEMIEYINGLYSKTTGGR